MWTDGRTDRQRERQTNRQTEVKELVVAFRNFANTPRKLIYV